MRGDARPMAAFSRGFRGRRVDVDPARVPPGQYVTRDFPVLSAGPTPRTPLDEWSLTVNGAVEEPVRRVDADMLSHVGPAPSQRPRIFICGPTAFVERAADLLVGLGHDPAAIHLERFGPTGG